MNTPEPGIYYYKAFSITMQSTFPIPEFLPVAITETPDVLIKISQIKAVTDCSIKTNRVFEASENNFLLNIDQVAKYLVEDGKKITIEPYEGVTDAEIRLYLLGSAFGALMHQRGLLPVHGSAILHNRKAILFCGRTGIGKSTLAAGFINKGFQILADDVCVITLDENNCPVVHPGYPQMKLWTDSVRKLGYKTNPSVTKRSKNKKYSLPLQLEFSNNPEILTGIYIISRSTSSQFNINTLSGEDKLSLLQDNIYHENFLKEMPVNYKPLLVMNSIAKQCFVKQVERPSQGFHLDRLIQLINEDMK